MTGDAELTDEEETCVKQRGEEDGWQPAPRPVVFKNVKLRWQQPPASENSKAVLPEVVEAECTVGVRSFCRVAVQPLDHAADTCPAPASAFEFYLGEEFGHRVLEDERDDEHFSFSPPPTLLRHEVAPWITEAVLCLKRPGSAVFEAVNLDDAESTGGLEGRCRLKLLKVQRAVDLLNDRGIMLRRLQPSCSTAKLKARDCATVRASWQVWFQRNSELILSTNDSLDEASAVECVIDDGKLMVALELGIKELEAGSRACLRISEEWGVGCLLPSGSPVLKGAAIWVELVVHHVTNEPAPGEHADAQAALSFALLKKSQGNDSLPGGCAADFGRALRRYEVGILALEDLIRDNTNHGEKQESASLQRNLSPDQRTEAEKLLTALRLNAAQAELKREHWPAVVSFCEAVLADGANAKAHYRRGLARAKLDDLDGAVNDLRSALALAENSDLDATLRRELARVQSLRQERRKIERKAYTGMFDKIKNQDEESERKRQEAEEKERERQREITERDAAERAKAAEAEAERNAAAKAEDEAAAQVKALTESLEQQAAEQQVERAAVVNSVKLSAGKQETGTLALAPPPNLPMRKTEAPPPVDYKVPSFLRKKKQPAAN